MTNNIFEKIRKINEYNQEFWSAREVFKVFGYSEYNKFIPVIDRAKRSCKDSKEKTHLHFSNTSKMVKIGLGLNRNIDDYNLSRYACYLISQNADYRKEEVAKIRTYFTIQATKQKLTTNLPSGKKSKTKLKHKK